jgi:competence protein ComGC
VKTFLSPKQNGAMTLVELLVVLAVIFILLCMLMAGLPRRRPPIPIQCVNNLKQVGLAFRVWEGDHGDNYPMAVSATNGGSMEFITGANAFRTYQVMSNELSTPKVLFCPQETDRHRFLATNDFFYLNNSNISFFVGIVPNETKAMMILSGDHNLTNGTPRRNGLLSLTTNSPAGWTEKMHNKVGNILLNDGSVQHVSISGLRSIVENTGVPTNRLQMPILSP